MNKVLYKTDSIEIKEWSYRISAIIFIGWGLANFSENPVGITIIVAFFILLILFVGTEKITVYDDRFVFRPASPVFWKRKRVYLLEQIDFVNCPVDYQIDNLQAKRQILNKRDPRQQLHIAFRNGENDIVVHSNRAQLLQAALAINLQLTRIKGRSTKKAPPIR